MKLSLWQNLPNRKRILFLSLYVAGTTVLFLFLLFPGEAVRKFVEENSRRLYPELDIKVQSAGLSPFLWVVLKDIDFSCRGDAMARVDTLKVRPSISNIWGRRAAVFSSRIFGGVVRGRVEQGGSQDSPAVEARLFGVKVEELSLKDYLPTYTFTGELTGSLQWGRGADRSQGQADLVIKNGSIVLTEPAFGLERLDFDMLEASLSLESGRVVIMRFEVKGPQVAGVFTGDIMLRHPYENSVLKIKGAITPQASLIEQLGETFPVELFIKKTPGDDGFPVTVSGTIAAPRFSMR